MLLLPTRSRITYKVLPLMPLFRIIKITVVEVNYIEY